jgi:O-antigen ligase
LFFLILSSFLVISNPPSVIEKFKSSESLFEDPRKYIRNYSYYAFKTSPLLGVGFGNYNNLGHEHIKDKVIEDLGIYEKEKYTPSAHTHNLYYNFLASGGIVMFFGLLWFFIQIIVSIWRIIKVNNRKELRYRDDIEVIKYRDDRLLILSSSMVFLTVLGIGFVNTTLSHEHAILSMFVLGLLLSKDRELSAR